MAGRRSGHQGRGKKLAIRPGTHGKEHGRRAGKASRKEPFQPTLSSSTIRGKGLKRVSDTRIRHVKVSSPGKSVTVPNHGHRKVPGTKHVLRNTTRLRKKRR